MKKSCASAAILSCFLPAFCDGGLPETHPQKHRHKAMKTGFILPNLFHVFSIIFFVFTIRVMTDFKYFKLILEIFF